MKETEWPNNGIDFNLWYKDLPEFIARIHTARKSGFWCADMDLKYLDIRVDTRNAYFLVYIEGRGDKRECISPNRVIAAIDKWESQFPGATPYKEREE